MKFLLSLLLFLNCFALFGQNYDLLESQKLAVDTLFFSDQSEALKISEKALPAAFESGDTNYITYFLDQAGELNRLAGHYDRAVKQLTECLDYKQNWEDLKDLSLTYNNLGKTYTQKGVYDLATYNFFEALKLMETDHNLIGQSFYLNNIAAVFDLQHNYENALDYYFQSLKIKETLQDEKGQAASFTNIGITYFNLGDLSKSAEFHKKAYDIYLAHQDTTRSSRAVNNLARAYIESNQLNSAKHYLLEVNSFLPSINDEKLKMDILNNTGLVYLKLNRIDSSEYYVKKVIEMAGASKPFAMLVASYRLYADVLKAKGELGEAFDYLEQSIAYNDSLINETNIYAIADVQGKYEYEKHQRLISDGKLAIAQKEKLIETQRANITFWVGIAFVAFMLVALFVILYAGKRRNALLQKGQLALLASKKEQLEELNQSIKNQLSKTKITLEEKQELLENVFSAGKEKELPPELLSLSKREMEVLSHLALGWTDDQLAEKLFVSKSTVKTHLRRIYAKLLVRGRAEAVAIAHKYNLIGELA